MLGDIYEKTPSRDGERAFIDRCFYIYLALILVLNGRDQDFTLVV